MAFCIALALPAGAAAHVSPYPEGTIAGLRVPPTLLDVIDPGGHSVDPAGIHCSDCLSAFVSNGYCRRSHIGYVDGQAYLSRLSYLLAKDGERVDSRTLGCSTCRVHMQDPGWCGRCGRGIVGTSAIRNHADFNEIMVERERLVAAVRLASRCDLCAVAFFSHGRCSRCRIDYRDSTLSAAGTR